MPDYNDRELASVEQQLAGLGFNQDIFHRALRADEAARRATGRLQPRNAAGTNGYFARVEQLRYGLITELGYKPKDYRGIPLAVNEEEARAVGVLLGNRKTGLPGFTEGPTGARSMGKAKAKLVTECAGQVALFDLPAGADDDEVADEEFARFDLWLLVSYRFEVRDPEDGASRVVVRSEFSKPKGVDEGARINGWGRRIILDNLTFDGVVEYHEDDEGPDAFDVAVEER